MATDPATPAGAAPARPAEQPDHIMQFFAAYENIKDLRLRRVAADFAMLAQVIVETVPRNPERTVALRHLLDGREAAYRAMVAK